MFHDKKNLNIIDDNFDGAYPLLHPYLGLVYFWVQILKILAKAKVSAVN